jgi:hypothetical protein
MAMKNYQKLRLTEFNQFDIERLMKTNIDKLEAENVETLQFINNGKDFLPQIVVNEMVETIEDKSAETTYIASVLHHTDDIYSFFRDGPLFRKDRDAK